jgi:BolA protein
MTVQSAIEETLRSALAPSHLQVINESHMHHVPKGSESHFKVVVVSEAFAGKTRVARQQEINRLLADQLAGPVHALSMQTMTAAEWEARGGHVMQSPDCLGGSRHGMANGR